MNLKIGLANVKSHLCHAIVADTDDFL